jgi:hypothetical protein
MCLEKEEGRDHRSSSRSLLGPLEAQHKEAEGREAAERQVAEETEARKAAERQAAEADAQVQVLLAEVERLKSADG